MVRLYTVPEDLREGFVKDAWTIRYAPRLFSGQLAFKTVFDAPTDGDDNSNAKPKGSKGVMKQGTASKTRQTKATKGAAKGEVNPSQPYSDATVPAAKAASKAPVKTPAKTASKSPSVTAAKTASKTAAKASPQTASKTSGDAATTANALSLPPPSSTPRRYMALYADESDSDDSTPCKSWVSSLPPLSSDDEVSPTKKGPSCR